MTTTCDTQVRSLKMLGWRGYLGVVFWLFILLLSSLSLFFSGYLISPPSVPNVSSPSNPPSSGLFPDEFPTNTNEWFTGKSRNMIWLIIDALRFDMVQETHKPSPSHHLNQLKTIQKLVKNRPEHAKIFKFVADPPTFTTQRIKAIPSGTLSSYIDLSSTLSPQKNTIDSIITQYNILNRRIYAAGDDIWDSMYKAHLTESHPFPSFDAFDLHTVDDGIIAILPSELEKMTKKHHSLSIFHFLGVDHVGHKHEIDHPEMAAKLKQMDEIIQLVISHIENNDPETILCVFGDHGMTDHGTHGGFSPIETDAGLFIYSPKDKFIKNDNEQIVFRQLDFAATIAPIVNVPIPWSSIGRIIPGVQIAPEPSSSELRNLRFQAHNMKICVSQIINYLFNHPVIKKGDDIFAIVNAKELKSELDQLESKIRPGENQTDLLEKYLETSHKFVIAVQNSIENAYSQFHWPRIITGIIGLVAVTLSSIAILLSKQTTRFNAKIIFAQTLNFALLISLPSVILLLASPETFVKQEKPIVEMFVYVVFIAIATASFTAIALTRDGQDLDKDEMTKSLKVLAQGETRKYTATDTAEAVIEPTGIPDAPFGIKWRRKKQQQQASNNSNNTARLVYSSIFFGVSSDDSFIDCFFDRLPRGGGGMIGRFGDLVLLVILCVPLFSPFVSVNFAKFSPVWVPFLIQSLLIFLGFVQIFRLRGRFMCRSVLFLFIAAFLVHLSIKNSKINFLEITNQPSVIILEHPLHSAAAVLILGTVLTLMTLLPFKNLLQPRMQFHFSAYFILTSVICAVYFLCESAVDPQDKILLDAAAFSERFPSNTIAEQVFLRDLPGLLSNSEFSLESLNLILPNIVFLLCIQALVSLVFGEFDRGSVKDRLKAFSFCLFTIPLVPFTLFVFGSQRQLSTVIFPFFAIISVFLSGINAKSDADKLKQHIIEPVTGQWNKVRTSKMDKIPTINAIILLDNSDNQNNQEEVSFGGDYSVLGRRALEVDYLPSWVYVVLLCVMCDLLLYSCGLRKSLNDLPLGIGFIGIGAFHPVMSPILVLIRMAAPYALIPTALIPYLAASEEEDSLVESSLMKSLFICSVGYASLCLCVGGVGLIFLMEELHLWEFFVPIYLVDSLMLIGRGVACWVLVIYTRRIVTNKKTTTK